ncbi:MAG: hypothetical protein GQ570_15130 [Helicobacteraceae bacterium]|nr:hypothetical protein [Helicobacteraceae bacterium]
MRETKILLFVSSLMFVPIDVLAYQKDIAPSSLRTLTYKQTAGNHLRFKTDKDGKLLINTNYKTPMQEELQTLYFKALESTPTASSLANEIYKLTIKQNRPIKKDTLYRYLHRFTFVQVEHALEIKELLQTFIKQNNLFEACL